MRVIVYFDGASSNNGRSNQSAGIGVVAYRNGKRIHSICKNVGNQTNNQAEWLALIEALKLVVQIQRNYEDYLILGDSKLVVEQFNDNWSIKNLQLRKLYEEAKTIARQINSFFSVEWIPRSENFADALAKKGAKSLQDRTFSKLQD